MTFTTFGRAMAFVPTVLLLAVSSASIGAQSAKPNRPEFTRQVLLIVNFVPIGGTKLDFGRDAADAVRGRVAKLSDKHDVDVLSGDDIDWQLKLSGYNADSTLSLSDIRGVGKYLRADEYLLASVTRLPEGFRLSGALVMMRDDHLRQPIPDVVAPGTDSAARVFGQAVAAARAQILPERRCENALRAGKPQDALIAARAGVAAYPRSTIARTCLVWAMRAVGSPAAQVLAEAQQLLAVDSLNIYGLENAAVSLDTLHRRDDAASMWLRLAATDTNNLDLVLRVSFALFDGGNAKRAEPFITHYADQYPSDARLVEQAWRVAYELKDWPAVTHAGEMLVAHDSTVRRDSVFYLRLATAYHATDRPYRALEVLARSVAAFPNDPRIYSLYTQYVKAEADTAVSRGLALFPHNADLLALNAKELRAKGKIAESLDATKQAVALDPSIKQGELTIAQLEIESGQPDSALVALRRAVHGGEDTSLVAAFALSKGNALYRAASGTKTSNDFGLALRFLSFADTLHASIQSTFLVGAAALGVAQASLAEAVKVDDKVESCRLAHVGADMVPVARTGLRAGQDAFGDAAKQSLDYLDQLEPYITQQVTVLCPKAP